MSGIDEMLEQAEAQQNADEWEILDKYRREVTYVDDDGYVNIVDRKIDPIKENISVQGEQYSQYIEFLMGRFYDGVDLAEQTIAIHYEVEGNGGEDTPVNVYKNSTQLKFGWIIGPNVAQYAQPVEFCIWVRGTLVNGNAYVLKTLPQTYTPKRGLMLGGGIPQPDNNWYLQFSLSMDDKVNQSALNASQAVNSANEAKAAETAVLQAQQEVSQKSEVVDTQYKEILIMHKEAEQYRDESLQFRNEAEQFSPDGYSALVEQVNKNTVKVDTIIEKADLGIKNTASGEEIYLFDSSNGKPPEFALFGKAKQETTSGAQLLDVSKFSSVSNPSLGVTFTVDVRNGSVNVKGTSIGYPSISQYIELNKGTYILSGVEGSTKLLRARVFTSDTVYKDYVSGIPFTIDDTVVKFAIYIQADNGMTFDETFYPMLNEGSTALPWEKYTGGQPSPNPDYPQEIEIAGESYNLLENTATSQMINGVTFTVNEDNSVTVNGTASADTFLYLNTAVILEENTKYIMNGAPTGSSNSSYRLDGYYEGEDSNKDNGNGVNITGKTGNYTVRIIVRSGVTVENSTFYPMIRKASVKNDRYMPYGKGSVEVKSCGKNFINYTDTDVNASFWIKGDVVNESTVSGLKIYLPKDEYTFSLKSNVAMKNALALNLYNLLGKRAKQYTTDLIVGYNSITFTIEEDVHSITSYTNVTGTFSEIQIEKGSKRTEYEPYKETTATIPTENGLAGIKVDSGGNYTDSNGQQWICDEIVKYADGSGEYVQRVGNHEITSIEYFGTSATSGGLMYSDIRQSLLPLPLESYGKENTVLCNLFSTPKGVLGWDSTEPCIISRTNNDGLRIYWQKDITTKEQANEFVTNNKIIVKYILAEPIHTPLTAEEISEIEKLSTFYPVTNITNDADCGMKVTYLCDSKNYIDSKIAELATAMVNSI